MKLVEIKWAQEGTMAPWKKGARHPGQLWSFCVICTGGGWGDKVDKWDFVTQNNCSGQWNDYHAKIRTKDFETFF